MKPGLQRNISVTWVTRTPAGLWECCPTKWLQSTNILPTTKNPNDVPIFLRCLFVCPNMIDWCDVTQTEFQKCK